MQNFDTIFFTEKHLSKNSIDAILRKCRRNIVNFDKNKIIFFSYSIDAIYCKHNNILFKLIQDLEFKDLSRSLDFASLYSKKIADTYFQLNNEKTTLRTCLEFKGYDLWHFFEHELYFFLKKQILTYSVIIQILDKFDTKHFVTYSDKDFFFINYDSPILNNIIKEICSRKGINLLILDYDIKSRLMYPFSGHIKRIQRLMEYKRLFSLSFKKKTRVNFNQRIKSKEGRLVMPIIENSCVQLIQPLMDELAKTNLNLGLIYQKGLLYKNNRANERLLNSKDINYTEFDSFFELKFLISELRTSKRLINKLNEISEMVIKPESNAEEYFPSLSEVFSISRDFIFSSLKYNLRNYIRNICICEKIIKKYKPSFIIGFNENTFFGRIVSTVAKRNSIDSILIQHGAMGDKHGFLPVISDYFITWGKIDMDKLIGWGVDKKKIFNAGPIIYDSLSGSNYLTNQTNRNQEANKRNQLKRPRLVLIFLSLPYTRNLCFLKNFYSQIEEHNTKGIEFILKLHPGDMHGVQSYRKNYPKNYVNVKILQNEQVGNLITKADLVVSPLNSTTGSDAVLLNRDLVVVNLKGTSEEIFELLPYSDENVAVEITNPGKIMETITNVLGNKDNVKTKLKNNRVKFMDNYFNGLDGKSSRRLINLMVK